MPIDYQNHACPALRCVSPASPFSPFLTRPDRKKSSEELAKTNEHLIRQIKKIGIRPLVRFGRGKRILEKIGHRNPVRFEVLRSYEQKVQEYKSSLELHQ